MRAATTSLERAGFDDVWGADADHLKTPADVDVTARAGFVFFTIDPSEHVDQSADGYSAAEVEARYSAVPWFERYAGRVMRFGEGVEVVFDTGVVKRAAVKYGRAIEHAVSLASHIARVAGELSQEHEVEVSIDETAEPTTLAEHVIIAEQLLERGVKLVSLAPRFIGELEKGVDYIGDLSALERSMQAHAAIARTLGPYKLSLHSGSDKLSMYPLFARATRGCFHVKTAGTAYLEALRVVAHHDAPLFRDIVRFSRARYDADKATYHVHATLADVPAPEQVGSDVELERLYLERWADVPAGKGFTAAGRQVLHCTFGSVVTDSAMGRAFRTCLEAHPDTYVQVLSEHFGRHLRALRIA